MTSADSTRLNGTLVRWDDGKGFGFIAAGGQDYFFHISAARGFSERPQVGQQFSFVPQLQGERWRATEVRVQGREAGHSSPSQAGRTAPKSQAASQSQVAHSKPPAPSAQPQAPQGQSVPQSAPQPQQRQPPPAVPRDKAQQVAEQAFQTLQTTPAYVLAVGAFAVILALMWLTHHVSLVVVAGYVIVSWLSYGIFAKDKAAARAGQWRTSENTLLWWSVLGGWPGALLAMYQHNHKRAKFSFMWRFWSAVAVNILVLLSMAYR